MCVGGWSIISMQGNLFLQNHNDNSTCRIFLNYQVVLNASIFLFILIFSETKINIKKQIPEFWLETKPQFCYMIHPLQYLNEVCQRQWILEMALFLLQGFQNLYFPFKYVYCYQQLVATRNICRRASQH